MITVFLRGGLGNQMFQYAAGLSAAKKNKTSLILDETFLNDRFPRRQFTYRTYDMDVFTLDPEFTLFSRISRSVPVPGLWLGLDLAAIKLRSAMGMEKEIREPEGNDAHPEMIGIAADSVLYGRWQSEKYFTDIKDDIRKAFTFRYPLNEEAEQLRSEIVASNSVAICSRRGDYVAFTNVKKIMGEMGNPYYSRAIDYIVERIERPRYFVFCDDVEWCKANMPLPPDTRYIAKMGPKWAFHLELMSLCKHAIITNSTFYWWGAWLNPNPQKIVIAPKEWQKGVTADNSDIIPKHWVTLP